VFSIFVLFVSQEDIETDCVRCGKRRHSFFDNPVGIYYLIFVNLDPCAINS
jgi:hypothetical protein